MKTNTVKNSFSDARKISSGEEETEHSLAIAHNVYRSNGYRYTDLNEETFPLAKSTSLNKPGVLCLDYVSEEVSNKIRNFIRKCKLNIRVIFLPGRKLRNIFCSSRPYDHQKCVNSKCSICPRIITKGKTAL